MDLLEIKDILKYASDYLVHLQKIKFELDVAEEQILSTADETEPHIMITFANLLDEIKRAINSRRDKLLAEVQTIRKQAIKPLQESRNVVLKNVQHASEVIRLGNHIVKTNDSEQLREFHAEASQLGSLPEVPGLKDVPYICFQLEKSPSIEILDTCSNLGLVSHIPPVQISTLSEKPGAILVEWLTTESDECMMDIQNFRLQRAFGNVKTNKQLITNFNDCYTGTDTQYLVKDLLPNQEYSFRVCCKFEGRSEWSSWSLSQVFFTTLMPFCWEKNADYLLTNENRIAKPEVDVPSVLFCDASYFQNGCSVEFTFLECDTELENTYVGLFLCKQEVNIKSQDSVCFAVDAIGNIFIDGNKKSTQLPVTHNGSKICFVCEKRADKLRINVDSMDKRVTYDWNVDNNQLYFGAHFNSPKWKIMIE